ncbi:MAG: PA0069 family radical SAM protein [Pseudomonadota bacterium]
MARAAHLSLRPRSSGGPPRPGGDRPPVGGKGRGARSNQSGRYEKEQREAMDDGWGSGWSAGADEFDGGVEDAPLKTDVTVERPKKIITFNKSPFVGFDRSINPYRGCEHGCIYCFARPTHAYMGLSPGLDFESRLFAKPNAAALLEKELSNPRYAPRVVAMGTNTDPYQPIERKFRIMRGVLETFSRFNHPVTILTKSSLITRDIDLLTPMAARNLTRAMVSITTEDKGLARAMEPRASAPAKRFEAVRQLKEAGIPVGVMTAPMIPGLNDDEMESLLERAKEAGADFAGYTIIRLPLEVSPLFQEWLETYAPARAKRIMRHIRDMNGGKDYDVDWSRGREIKAPYAQLLAQRFKKASARLGLDGEKPPMDLTQFRVPAATSGQMSLFD